MKDYTIEDTVILLDTSRSMLKRDFKPDRLRVAIQTAINFIKAKFAIDPKDRISVITFGEDTKKLCPFSFNEEKVIESLKKIYISGKGQVHDGIAFSLQILVEEMRKLGGKIGRIFIISDDRLVDDLNKLQKMIKISKGLGIYIDACQLGETQDYKQSTLKRISQMTGGEYGFFNNSKAIINAGKAFASKKAIKDTSDFFDPNKESGAPPLVSEIALPLRRPTVMEIRMMMKGGGRDQDKCQICHSTKAPLTTADFYSEGRYCPSCDRAMHLSCAAMWAKKSEFKENVMRCPFCFFLLEIPKSVAKLVDTEKKEEEPKIRIIDEDENKAKLIEIDKENIEFIDASCIYCRSIFLGDTKVFKCEKCSSFYHEPCLNKVKEELGACRYCGSEFML